MSIREGKSGIPQLHTDDDFKNYLNQNPQFNLIDDKGLSELRIKLGNTYTVRKKLIL